MKYALGTAQFGMDYGVQGARKLPQGAVSDMIAKAAENGISILDTAPVYGNAETVVGACFTANPLIKQSVQVISKLSAGALRGKPQERWKSIICGQASASLKRLKLPKLEAYLFHDASFLMDKNAVKALYQAVKEGLANKVGVSVYKPYDAMKALEYDEVTAVQVPFNLFDHRLDHCGFFKQAKEKGVTVYARSPLLQGLVTMDPGKLPRNMQFAQTYLRRFRTICMEYGLPPLEAAFCFAGNHKGIDYVLFGADNIKQLEEIISIKDSHLPDGMEERLTASFAEVEEKLVNPVLWDG